MESFEAILRNLEQAQRRGLETVTNRLEFVIESLQELINEATASVREASPADAEELFPIAEIRSAVEAAKARAAEFAGRVEELERQAGGGAQGPPPAAPAGATGPSLPVLRKLDAARSQSELLRELLTILAESAGRAVVLVLRDGRVSAWSGIGLTDAERLRLWSGDAAASPALERLVTSSVCCQFDPSADPVFSTWLAGEPEATEALLVPFVLRGRLVGTVYVDRVEGSPWAPDVVQAMVAVACWLIDTLPYRQAIPFPSLSEAGALDEAAVAAPEPEPLAPEAVEEPEPEPEAEPEAEPEPEPEEEEEEEVGPAEVEAPVEEAPAEPEEAAEAPEEGEPSAYDPSATIRMEPAAVVPEEAPVAEPEEEDVPAEEEVPTPPPVQPVTPPPVEEEAPSAGEILDEDIPAEQQPLHEEARRFARLLVSEIKLYNEEEVEQGRVNNDIYQRLKEDIDRSREMFDARVAAEVRELRDYFKEELVRILGDGDPDTLGM